MHVLSVGNSSTESLASPSRNSCAIVEEVSCTC